MTTTTIEQAKDIAVTERQSMAISAGLVLLRRAAELGELRFDPSDPDANEIGNIVTSAGTLEPLDEDEMEELTDLFATLHPATAPTPGR